MEVDKNWQFSILCLVQNVKNFDSKAMMVIYTKVNRRVCFKIDVEQMKPHYVVYTCWQSESITHNHTECRKNLVKNAHGTCKMLNVTLSTSYFITNKSLHF